MTGKVLLKPVFHYVTQNRRTFVEWNCIIYTGDLRKVSVSDPQFLFVSKNPNWQRISKVIC